MIKTAAGLNVLFIEPSGLDKLGLEKLLGSSRQSVSTFQVVPSYTAALEAIELGRPAVIFSMVSPEVHLDEVDVVMSLQRKLSAPVILITHEDPANPEALLESVTDLILEKNLEPNFLRF